MQLHSLCNMLLWKGELCGRMQLNKTPLAAAQSPLETKTVYRAIKETKRAYSENTVTYNTLVWNKCTRASERERHHPLWCDIISLDRRVKGRLAGSRILYSLGHQRCGNRRESTMQRRNMISERCNADKKKRI